MWPTSPLWIHFWPLDRALLVSVNTYMRGQYMYTASLRLCVTFYAVHNQLYCTGCFLDCFGWHNKNEEFVSCSSSTGALQLSCQWQMVEWWKTKKNPFHCVASLQTWTYVKRLNRGDTKVTGWIHYFHSCGAVLLWTMKFIFQTGIIRIYTQS